MDRQKILQVDQKTMSSAAFVDEASQWTEELVKHESRGRGDRGDALVRLAFSLRVSRSTLWTLLYRKPKGIDTAVYSKLQKAHDAIECRRHREAAAFARTRDFDIELYGAVTATTERYATASFLADTEFYSAKAASDRSTAEYIGGVGRPLDEDSGE
ncbi:MAG: hypothetical protein WDN46_10200 [Methylocella sp.]